MGRVIFVQKPLTSTRQHSQRLLSALLLTTCAIACFPCLAIESAKQQQNAKPALQPTRINRNSLWESILQLLK